MPNLDIVGACERIVREADTLAGENYAFNLRRRTGALDWITSPENGGVENSLISYQSGTKNAKLLVRYDQRTKVCQVIDDCDSNICDPGTTPPRLEQIITINQCIKTPVRAYSNEDMTGLCENTGEFMRKRALSDLRAAHERLDEKILAFLGANIGVNHENDGTTTNAGSYKDIQLLATSGSQQVPLAGNFAQVMADYANNQLTGTPAIIGQGNLDMFYRLQKMACCNATTPYGEENLDGDARFYLDQAANSVLGANRFIVAANGAAHLLTFAENRNINLIDKTQAHFTMADPFGYGFDWNVDFYFDECDKVWKWQYSILWGAFTTYQDDSFSELGDSPDTSPDCADDLLGMNGLFGYVGTSA